MRFEQNEQIVEQHERALYTYLLSQRGLCQSSVPVIREGDSHYNLNVIEGEIAVLPAFETCVLVRAGDSILYHLPLAFSHKREVFDTFGEISVPGSLRSEKVVLYMNTQFDTDLLYEKIEAVAELLGIDNVSYQLVDPGKPCSICFTCSTSETCAWMLKDGILHLLDIYYQ